MKRIVWFLLLGSLASLDVAAQRVLTLDSCRAMALGNNKQMSISRTKQDVARNLRKAARTTYLPRVNAIGSYLFTSREISILNNAQKAGLSQMGSSVMGDLAGQLSGFTSGVTPEMKAKLDAVLGQFGTSIDQVVGGMTQQMGGAEQKLNAEGQRIVDAFRTDTRNIFAGSIMVTQPIYMGGSLIAMNKLADLGEAFENSAMTASRQQTLYNIDNAYWLVVSLKHKKRLAESYLKLIDKLDGDVTKMIAEGVATKSDGLNVSVRRNEAEMTVTQVDNGLALARMNLCQLCGLQLDEPVMLADEDNEDLAATVVETQPDMNQVSENRPELQMLRTTAEMSLQTVNLLKAGNLPQVALIGGYSVSNPNTFDGFQKKFGGAWNIGVLVRIPVWNWGDVAYKVRAAKGAATIARLEEEEAREKIELQVNQSAFKVKESAKRLAMAKSNIAKAEENLRCADLGYREGVIQLTTVMEAQTAWLQAQSQKIDAEIDVKLSEVNMKKALGTLNQ